MPSKMITDLPRTRFSGLDYDNIIEDIVQLVHENPDYNNDWDDFLSSNAGRMIVELFAYISDQLATRIDWVVNENFLSTATQKKSILRLLNLIGYSFELPFCSEVRTNVTFDVPAGVWQISEGYDITNNDARFFSLRANNKNGEKINFEVIHYDKDTKMFDYLNPLEINTGSPGNLTSTEVLFYEGKTFVEEKVVEVENNQIFTLSQFPVIQNSVRVYEVTKDESGNDQIKLPELMKVDSFLDREAQRPINFSGGENPIPYVITTLENSKVQIEFGPTSLLNDIRRRPSIGSKIKIFYRVGGGSNTNITRRSINVNRKININGINSNVNFINFFEGVGGKDEESVEMAKIRAPFEIRTAGKTVTPEDYDIILGNLQGVLKSKSYGNSNMPPQLFQLYNIFIRPLEVWNFLLKDQPGWKDVNPSEYNIFRWITLRLENRFNEPMAFRNGSFNNSINLSSSLFFENSSEGFKNFIHLRTPDKFKESLFKEEGVNEDFISSLTIKEIDPNQFFTEEKNNIFDVKRERNNKGVFSAKENFFELFEKLNAIQLSENNVSDNIDVSEKRYIKISFDNREYIEIDLYTEMISAAGYPDNVSAIDIKNKINEKFHESQYYNNNQTITQKGSQRLGLSFSNENDDSGLDVGKKYSFRINGIEYKLKTEEGVSVSYLKLRDKIEESISIDIYGDYINFSDRIRNVFGGNRIVNIKKGMRVLDVPNTVGEVRVLESNIKRREIKISQDAGENSPESFIRVCPYDVDINEIEPGVYDIVITNPQEDPNGAVWIQEGQYRNIDLLSSLGASKFSFIPNDGVSGYHDLGINAVINSTRGFQVFEGEVLPFTSGIYSFRLEINNESINNDSPISVDLDSGDNLQTIINKIKAEIDLIIIEDIDNVLEFDLDYYGKLKITSKLYGSNSNVIFYVADDINSIGEIVNILGGVVTDGERESIISGEDDGELKIEAGDYNFKVNDFIYEINISENETFLSLSNKIQDVLLDHGYTVSIRGESEVESEWNQDIRITFDTSDSVYFESINFFEMFENLVYLDEGFYKEIKEWEQVETPIGGGDYSNVVSLFTYEELGESYAYFQVTSPTQGEFASAISFQINNPSQFDASFSLFGVQGLTDEIKKAMGYKRATLIMDEESVYFKDIIFEIGSFDLTHKFSEEVYIQYINSDFERIPVGRYFTDNFEENSLFWREPAQRIYNTVYNTDTKKIDDKSTEYFVRFTVDETDKNSIFSIQNDWLLEIAKNPSIKSVINPTNFISSSKKSLRISFDGFEAVEIDIFSVGDTFDLAGQINDTIKNSNIYGNMEIYNDFEYASVSDDNSVVLRSPTAKNNSRITFLPLSSLEGDALDVIFNLPNEGNYEHIIKSDGDFYFEQHEEKILVNLNVNNEMIYVENTEDIHKIKEKMFIFPKSDVINRTKILSVDEEEGMFIVDEPPFVSGLMELSFTNNDLMITRIEKEEEDYKFPDLKFYMHFIFDKRITEGVYDGEIKQSSAEKYPGFAFGELDEDFYKDQAFPKKIISIENIFKQTRFKTFDFAATIFYDRVFSLTEIRDSVRNAVNEEYSLENRGYGEMVVKSKLTSIINNVNGVNYLETSYFGFDFTNIDTNVENTLISNFDEILVLSEDIFMAGRQVHGLVLNFRPN